jgi:Sulfotransferase domain
MTIQVIGAGLGRTGTHSLGLALERLLGGPCYRMIELFKHPEHVQVWEQALDGHTPDWDTLFAGYRATGDWTGAAFFAEHAEAYPDAIVLLSVRDADDWWRSFRDTMLESLQSEVDNADPWERALAPARQLTIRLLADRFTPDWADEVAAKAAFERHNAAVRTAIAPGRLVEWRAGDGWEPICAALGRPVPADPFPHVNTTADFRAGRFEVERD